MDKRYIILVGGVLAVGVGVSVVDYRAWRYEVTKNYGHGPAVTLLPSQQVEVKYANAIVGVRMKYPMNWRMKENDRVKVVPTGKAGSLENVVGVNALTEVASWTKPDTETEIKLEVKRKNVSTTDEVQNMVSELGLRGVVLDREREALNTERNAWVQINWNEGGFTNRKAVTTKNGVVVILSLKCKEGELDKYLNTFEEVVRRVTLTF